MGNSLLLINWESDKQLPSMEDQYISIIVMITQESSSRKLASLKAPLNSMRMINGQQQLLTNGYLKRMPKWNSTFRKSLVEERLTPKNSS